MLLSALPIVLLCATAPSQFADSEQAQPPSQSDAITFNRQIAPIIFENCAACHRADEVAPFSLLTYKDVKRRARQISEVTQSRYMPPWLPEPRHGKFIGERRLTDQQIQAIQQWVKEGSVEGDPSDLPPSPQFAAGWQSGDPDLIIEAPQAYTLQAQGEDVFHNLVLPTTIGSMRFVKKVELRPDNRKVVHHFNLLIDTYGESRVLDEQQPEPGFPGMESLDQAHHPGGHFVFWKPGSPPYSGHKDKAWRLDPGTNLVLNMHLLPTGKVEKIRPKVGLYFTDSPPEPPPFFLLQLEHDGNLDIPPGESDFVITDDFKLPTDVEVFGIYPHAHLLGKDLQGYATRPDGTKEPLIWIKQWDWNWQAVYQYQTPIHLPKGSTISMRFSYDNSEENPRNPNRPPQRVTAGNRTTDEMGHLWIQVLPRSEADFVLLQQAMARHRLDKYPHAINPRNNLAASLMEQGQIKEAIVVLRQVLSINPDHPNAIFNLAIAMKTIGKLDGAIHQYRRYLTMKPRNAEAMYQLGLTYELKQEFNAALQHLKKAIQIKPAFVDAHLSLGRIHQKMGDPVAAIENFQKIIQIQSDHAEAHYNLGATFGTTGQTEESLQHFREVIRYLPKNPVAWDAAAIILATSPNPNLHDPQEAIRCARRAVELTRRQHPQLLGTLAAAYAAAGQFDQAVSTAEIALKLANTSGLTHMVDLIHEQLNLYKAGKPYIEHRLQP